MPAVRRYAHSGSEHSGAAPHVSRPRRAAASRGIGRGIRSIALVLALLAAPWPVNAEPARTTESGVRAIEVKARPISAFQRANPLRSTFGRLTFRGGLVLTSSADGFGGFSGLLLDEAGRKLLAVSDEGAWLAAEIAYKGDAPSAIVAAGLGRIAALRGRTLDRKRDLDAESMTLVSGTLARGEALIGFERNHRIGVFPIEGGGLAPPTRYIKLPPDAKAMRSNKGFEAVAVLKGGPRKGAIVAFSERYPRSDHHVGWLWVGGQPQRLTMTDIGEFEITDAASLKDGRLLVLERRFRWTEGVKMRLREIPADAIRPGALLEGQVLLEADLSYEIDNMEGLAIHTGPAGETVLTLLSDDNFNTILQRTLLLQFVLTDAPTAHRQR
jgi:hypothetical protein